MMLFAPGRLSITNCWPSRSDSHWPIRRAVMSPAPAGAIGTIRRTGRVGESCAFAIRDIAGSAAALAARWRKFRRGSFILNLPLVSLFDHLVSAQEERLGNGQPDCLCRPEVDHKVEFHGLLNGQLRRFGTFEYFVHVYCRAAIKVRETRAIRHQPASFDKFSRRVNRGQPIPRRKQSNELAIWLRNSISSHDERVHSLVARGIEGRPDIFRLPNIEK